MKSVQNILRNSFLFENLSEKDFYHCLEFGGYNIKQYSCGDIMQNAMGDKKIGIILSGKAVIVSGDDGIIIKKISENDVYGVAILFNEPKYLTKVVAISTCKVLLIDKEFVLKCIAYNNIIAENYIKYLAEKISFLNSKISSYTAKKAENKLYAYLIQLPRENSKVTLTMDYSSIAKTIGIGRASLYRSFEKLEKDGYIIKEDKSIIIKEVIK